MVLLLLHIEGVGLTGTLGQTKQNEELGRSHQAGAGLGPSGPDQFDIGSMNNDGTIEEAGAK